MNGCLMACEEIKQLPLQQQLLPCWHARALAPSLATEQLPEAFLPAQGSLLALRWRPQAFLQDLLILARNPQEAAVRAFAGCFCPAQAFWGCDGLQRGSAASAASLWCSAGWV